MHIHLRAIELHQAGTRQFASGVARQASFLSDRSKTWGTECTLLCGRWIAAHCTLPPMNLHEFSTASQARYCIAFSTIIHCIASHFHVLACMGCEVAQLWDIKSHQPLGQAFGQESLTCVSFSPDGRYLAYGGEITLWIVRHWFPACCSHN